MFIKIKLNNTLQGYLIYILILLKFHVTILINYYWKEIESSIFWSRCNLI